MTDFIIRYGRHRESDEMKNIYDLTKDELKNELCSHGEQPYRAKQVFSWLHARGISTFDDMSDIPKGMRAFLKESYTPGSLSVETVQRSQQDGTEKFLFALEDRKYIEGVFMAYRSWNSACISSQAGCAMGCRFCASALNGLDRDLTAGEMTEEVRLIERHTGKHISKIVVMGSGEPLLNYNELMRFIDIMTDPDGRAMSQRSITVSTCGIVPGIIRLAEEKRNGAHLQINLAISLHAATDEKRRELMPVAQKYPLSELMEAAGRYYRATHRKLTFEYALIAGENDTDEDAERLARLIKDIHVPHLVNLIPVNPVAERGLKRPDKSRCVNFKNKLENFGINGSIRRELGSDIDGACGQLRMRNMKLGGDPGT